jgi:diguanylate cyclase (GGDEF)-like protein
MIDVGEALARPLDRQRARIAAGCAVIAGVLALPFAALPLGPSLPVAAIVVSVSFTMLAIASILLWTQARVTLSLPLLTLATTYGATAALMVPYLLLYRGLWPQFGRLVAADPQTPAWLWFDWHLLMAAWGFIYVLARTSSATPGRVAFLQWRSRAVRIAAVWVGITVAAAVWVHGLPALYAHGRFTVLSTVCSLGVALVASMSIAALYAHNRFRCVLDVWLGVATVCVVVDVVLSGLGAAPYTVGWYVSSADILVASSAVLIALVFQTASVYAQLGRTADRLLDESLTDALTGLSNRRSFDARLTQIIADGARTQQPVALMIIDVDHFKLYNDAFGHPAGDACLRSVAAALRESVTRGRDLVARIGGEELAVVMPETDARGAMIVGERVRESVEALGIQHSREASAPVVTVSIGIAAIRASLAVPNDELIAEADRALYRAKHAGRNRTMLDIPAGPPASVYVEATKKTRGTAAGRRATIS